MRVRLNRREMLDHLHTLAHYVRQVSLPEFEHALDEELLVFRIAVHRARYMRLLYSLQDFRDRVRRGSYLGTIGTDRPFTLDRPDWQLARHLVDEHAVLGEMLLDAERMAIWTRAATTVVGEPVAIRRYAYVPDEFRRRAEAMGIKDLPLPITRKRDMRRPGWGR